MHKDLHDIDELFRTGLNDYKATPSAGVKENIDAALDKQDAEKYKKRFILWKRTALLLLLSLAGFVLHESGLIKSGDTGHLTNNSGDKNKSSDDINANHPTIQNDNTVVPQQQINTAALPEKNQIENGIAVFSNKNTLNKQVNLFAIKIDPLFPIISLPPDKKEIDLVANYDNNLPANKTGIEALDKRISVASVTERLTKDLSFLPAFIASSSPTKAGDGNSSADKKSKPFQPFWMIAPFAAYERAAYRLDSDLPNNISAIKHKEVHEPSFSFGLLVTRQLKPQLGLQSGLTYSNTVIGINPQKLYAFQDAAGDIAYKYVTSSGYTFIKPGFGNPPSFGDSINAAEGKHVVKHISVPVVLKYTIGKNKLSLSTGAGIEANFITRTKVETEIEDASNKETVFITRLDGIKPFYLSAVIDAELRCRINKKISVSLRPYYRIALSPSTKNNVVETFPRSFGTAAGITISL